MGQQVKEPFPLVTMLIVVRNEREHVAGAIESFLHQDYPRDKTEIILVDGESTDGTAEYLRRRVDELSQEGWKALFLTNPRKTLASGWNIGIRAAGGDVVCRIDAHGEIGPQYIRCGVESLLAGRSKGLAAVGGVIAENVGRTWMARVAADLSSSRFGIGNSPFRITQKHPVQTDTAVYALYWRHLFDDVGFFDESLRRNQDLDLHFRLQADGWRFLTHPEMRIRYHVRSDFGALARKALLDGYWVIATARSRWRHRIPLFFSAYVLASWPIVCMFGAGGWAPLALYALLAAAFAIKDGHGLLGRAALPAVFFLFHFCYGLGSLGGATRRLRGRIGEKA